MSAAGIGTTRERIGPRGIGDRLSTRVGWSVFGVGLVVLFSVGALHPHASTVASRVANLDNIIKCPPCSGLSIAQSNTPQARRDTSQVLSFSRRTLVLSPKRVFMKVSA